MRNLVSALLIPCAIGFMFLSAGVHEEAKPCHGKCEEWIKEVEVEIENTENGIILYATSENPEIVKLIQGHAVHCMNTCTHNFCRHGCSGQCINMHKTEECKIHKEGTCSHIQKATKEEGSGQKEAPAEHGENTAH